MSTHPCALRFPFVKLSFFFSEGLGEPRVKGSSPMAAAAFAADALAAERCLPPGLETEAPRAAWQCASARPRDSARAGGAASGDALGSTATAAAPTMPMVSVASELSLLGDVFASRQQVNNRWVNWPYNRCVPATSRCN